MRISVIRSAGVQPARPLAFDFGEGGGSIGRDDANQLRLPDPDRHISRVQARVEFSGGRFFLVDMGANPSLVNGRPLGKGNRVALTGGEEITIDVYVLRVEYPHAPPVFSNPLAAPTPVDDPLGLLGSAGDSGARPSRPVERAVRGGGAPPAAAPAEDSFPLAGDDPFAVFGLLTPQGRAPGADAAQPDHDPFAAPPPPPVAPSIDPLGLGFGRNEESVDAMFELEGSACDPLAGTPLGACEPEFTAAERKGVDPLVLFGGRGEVQGHTPQRDDAPLLNQAVSLPRPVASPVTEMAPAIAQPPVHAAAGNVSPARAGVMVRSWDQVPAAVEQRPTPSVAEARVAPPNPRAAPRPDDRSQLETAASAAASPLIAEAAGARAELVEAFRKGLGIPVNLPARMTPELMEQVGVMLREAMQGTIDLLKARAETKREVRAQATMIVSKGNNPLKFSPDVGFALSQLLLPQGGGFMKPEEAMRDAYDDLRAHQIGFMAGMSAALAGVLKRFEPAVLEQRVVGRSLLDNILPGSHKARLWDLFEQMYGEISREAADDFHTLFGREFLKAYEEQVQRLEAGRDGER